MKTHTLVLLAVSLLIDMSWATCLATIPTVGLKETQLNLTLEVRSWPTHYVNNQLLQILLTELLGIPTTFYHNSQHKDWELVANGTVMVDAELWPMSQSEGVQKYINTEGTVENVGLLGAVGGVGFYVSTSTVQKHPKLATWEGFKDPEMVKLFKYKRDLTYDPSLEKGTFFAGPTDWSPGEQIQRIKNLKLPYTVEYADNFDHWVERFDMLLGQNKDFFGYLYVPNELAAKYDLTRVELPPYTDECYAKRAADGLDCDYSSEFLIKTANINLNRLAPMSYQVLKSLSMTTEEFTLLSYEMAYKNKTVYQAACDWLHLNKKKWQRWIPPTYYLYEECPAGRENIGTYVVGEDARGNVTFCASCPVGHFSPTKNSICQKCDTKSYNSEIGATLCLPCPMNSNTEVPGATSVNQCVCSPGFFRIEAANASELRCEECPPGAICPGGSAAPHNRARFWSTASNPLHFRQCLNEEACPEAVAPGTCPEGYEGVLCGECSREYYQNDGSCRKCSAESHNIVLTILLWFVFAFILLGLILSTDLAKNRVVDRSSVAWKTSFAQTLVYLQLLAVLGFGGVGHQVSPSFRVFTAPARVSNFNFEIFSLQCVFPAKWVTKYRSQASAGMVLVVFLLCFWGFTKRKVKCRKALNTAIAVSLRILSVGVIFGISTVLELFQCYEQPYEKGIYTAEKQPSISCYTSAEWKALLPFAVVALFVLAGAYPLIMCGALYLAPTLTINDNQDFLERFSPAFRPFKDTKWYWQLVILARKLSISMLLSAVTINRTLDSVIALWCLIMFLALQLHYRPYFHNANNRLEALQTGSLLLNGLILLASASLPRKSAIQAILVAVYVASTCVSIVIGVLVTRHELLQYVYRQNRLTKGKSQFASPPWRIFLSVFLIPTDMKSKTSKFESQGYSANLQQIFDRVRHNVGFGDLFAEKHTTSWVNAVCEDDIASLQVALISLIERYEWQEAANISQTQSLVVNTVRKPSKKIYAHQSFDRALEKGSSKSKLTGVGKKM